VPHLASIRITFSQEIVGALGRANGSISPVLFYQQLRGAEYVGIGDLETSFPAMSALPLKADLDRQLSQVRFVPIVLKNSRLAARRLGSG
jgi:hypothetical protein